MTTRRSFLIYAILLAAWVLVLGWQAAEHLRVREAAKTALIHRARDITSTVGLVIRSQRRFGGIASKERLELALKELIKPGELSSVALLSPTGDMVVTAGNPIDPELKGSVRPGEHWTDQNVTLMNLVDLGVRVTQETNAPPPTLVLRDQEIYSPFSTNRPPPRPPPPSDGYVPDPASTNSAADGERPPSRTGGRTRFRPGGDGRPPSFVRPFWMTTEEYQSLIQKQGVHSFLIVLSTQSMQEITERDFWMRIIICLLATAVAGVSGFAWRNFVNTADLQIRLVKASEMNAHLKQMNLATAGLAHETRNPLNIIRGLAQMISREPQASPDMRDRSHAILEEADRVTAQLNEFINYSRPREVRRAPVPVGRVLNEVSRALAYDAEEKKVTVKVPEETLVIEADDQLLRQTLFNLLLNAVQAVDNGGEVSASVHRNGSSEASLEIRDNGPGVPPENRSEIFKPYFTTNQKGTGLGLAVVQQIVSAHGWDIEFHPNEPRGAIFRINHLKLVSKA
jgi:signal transduction histidine kinase